MTEPNEQEILRNKIIGLGENSARKSFFPELQRKIQELEESEYNLLALFNNTFDAVFIVDTQGRLLNVNQSMMEMFDMPDKAAAMEFTLRQYLLDASCCPSNALLGMAHGHEARVIECKVVKPLSNVSFDAELAIKPTPWYGADAAIVLVRDISFRKQSEAALLEREHMLKQQNEELMVLNEELAESNRQIIDMNEKLKKANKRAVESDRLKTAFLANMSHEIRTPMNGIVGFASLITSPGIDPESLNEYVGIINGCSQQLLTIINDIIDVAKIESGQVAIVPVDTYVVDLLRETHLFFQAKVAAGVRFDLEIPDQCNGFTLFTDPDRLRQVLINLVGNAIKFTAKGRIAIGLSIESNKAIVYVSDTGIGIAPQNLRKIFKRFHQVQSSDSRPFGGTGIGLAISKALVEMMGGRITVESKLGVGSTFRVELPF